MRCYLWGTNNCIDREERGTGVSSFAIPDWGLQYRAAQPGRAIDCEYSALLSLLQFVHNNPKVFEGHTLDLFCDSAELVEQVHQRLPVGPGELRVWSLVRAIKARTPFSLTWIPTEQNRAREGILDLAPRTKKLPAVNPALDSKPDSARRRRPDITR